LTLLLLPWFLLFVAVLRVFPFRGAKKKKKKKKRIGDDDEGPALVNL
jgi:hypothetical protein